MALVKFGGGITQMSGSIAGNTFARNRAGNYVRARTKPVNPNTIAQGLCRTAVSMLTARWHDIVSSDQRIAWGTFAAAVAAKNKLGETTYNTGFNHFIRGNASRNRLGLTIINDGPTTLAMPSKDTTLALLLSAPTQELSITYDDALDWAGETGSYMLVFMGQPQLATRNFFAGPWKYAGLIAGVTGSPPASPQLVAAPFVITPGQKVFIYATIVRADGRVSERTFTNSEVALSYTMGAGGTPDPAGLFTVTGMFNNKPYLVSDVPGYHIWWDGVDRWVCSVLLGTEGAAFFDRTDPDITGEYIHGGTATGDPILGLTP